MHNPAKPRNINDFIKWRDQAAFTTLLVLALGLLAFMVGSFGIGLVSWALSDPPPPVVEPEEPPLPACSDARMEVLSTTIANCIEDHESHKYETKCVAMVQRAICSAPEPTQAVSAPLLERVAAVEHRQWTAWSTAVASEVSDERRKRWEQYWVPYEDLPDHIKDDDRHWARIVLAEVDAPQN